MLKKIFISSFIFSVSLAMTAYLNSTFIAERINPQIVGLIYSIGAILTLVGLEILPKIIARVGNRKSISLIIGIALLSLLVMINSSTPVFIGIAFILYQSMSSLTWYSLDIFVEHFSKDQEIGKIRGLYLSINSLAWVFSPLIAGTIVGIFGYQNLYTTVFVLLVILLTTILFFFKNYKDSSYRKIGGIQALEYIYKHRDLAKIMGINFTLQFFFAWMVIYTPIYLHEVLGIDFKTIGLMFMIMLTPFVMFEYPLGKLADKFHNEKKFIFFGLLLMSISTLTLGFIINAGIILITAILFMSRVGASTVEVMSESYFFRRVDDSDPAIISLFRSMAPIAYVVAPLIATVILSFVTYTTLFVILGFAILLVSFVVLKLNEQR
jgi:MFS family permease